MQLRKYFKENAVILSVLCSITAFLRTKEAKFFVADKSK